MTARGQARRVLVAHALHMKALRVGPLLVVLTVIYTWSPAYADQDPGQREYASRCAVCHDVDGKGNGPLYASGLLNKKPSDLTMLAKKNGGVFPVQRIYQLIDGRSAVAAHGSREMPVWGAEHYDYAEGAFWTSPGGLDPEVYVRARILALIDHLARMQTP